MLCTNRPEGFGPHSSLSAPIPTSCFVDVILIPLPIWIALLTILLSLALPPKNHATRTLPRTRAHKIVLALYYVLIVCNIAMHALEIARLVLLGFGIGLLPFMFVGLLLGAGLHFTSGLHGRIPIWRAINVLIWLGGMTMSIIKVVGLHNEGIDRAGTAYPMSDQILDVAVMAGVYAVLAVLEGVLLSRWSNKKAVGPY